MPAAGVCPFDGDQRRLAGGQSLSDVQPVEVKLGCSQLLQKELDTIKTAMPLHRGSGYLHRVDYNLAYVVSIRVADVGS